MSPPTAAPRAVRVTDLLVQIAFQERVFLALVGGGFLAVGVFYQDAAIARWLGFVLASYAAVANDSIQTIGTFIASNRRQRWWVLWLFIGGLFLATVIGGWLAHDGDVSYGRLASKGFEQTPTSFSFLQVAAPMFLLILTRLRMPVSTTFLLLSGFAAGGGSVEKVLMKSLSGWVVAFVVAFIVWIALARVVQRWFRGVPHPGWRVAQWLTSGALWCVWLMQDAANIAVYLPRRLDVAELAAFCGVIFVGLGVLFRLGGDRIQQVVDEKSDVIDVRMATMIDVVYAAILVYFQWIDTLPMSTTWVFLGLLGGRELAMSMRRATDRGTRAAVVLMARDLLFAGIGLVVSLIIAAAVNPAFRAALAAFLGLG